MLEVELVQLAGVGENTVTDGEEIVVTEIESEEGGEIADQIVDMSEMVVG